MAKNLFVAGCHVNACQATLCSACFVENDFLTLQDLSDSVELAVFHLAAVATDGDGLADYFPHILRDDVRESDASALSIMLALARDRNGCGDLGVFSKRQSTGIACDGGTCNGGGGVLL